MRIKKMLAILTAAMMAVAVAGCSASTQGGSDTGKETGKEDAGAASEADRQRTAIRPVMQAGCRERVYP